MRHGHTPVRGRTRVALAAGATVVATFGLMSGAQALWSASDHVTLPAIQTGAVTFGAAPQDGSTLTYSPDGGPVTITLPGSEIIKVLDQTGIDPPPVIWTFTASGQADGIAGLTYGVALTEQVAKNGAEYDLSSGVAQDGTILYYTTLKVYPASINGDCSSVPATPEPADGEAARNVYLFDADGHVLQKPGIAAQSAIPAAPTVQKWCVAMSFNNDPDGEYANDAQATGTAEDGTTNGALDSWRSAVAFPPSLPALGDYFNRALTWGTADDLTISRDEDHWSSTLYPDPSGEPSVTISLDPAVTNQNPAVQQPGDHFAPTSL